MYFSRVQLQEILQALYARIEMLTNEYLETNQDEYMFHIVGCDNAIEKCLHYLEII